MSDTPALFAADDAADPHGGVLLSPDSTGNEDATPSPAAAPAPAATPSPESVDVSKLAPGSMITARNERWIVTEIVPSADGRLIRATGISDYVRDFETAFYTAIDRDIQVFDPLNVTPVVDKSPRMRDTRVHVETILRQTPEPAEESCLTVSTKALADALPYQHKAVIKALKSSAIHPRILLADAVGLGKTLEIGMILAELIRRGRGARILVVTPLHVMEQFQQEMWTRFAIPLVRLDSEGIRRIRQKLPASQNPFSYYPRVIASIDTLKSPKYLTYLRETHWDCVVIDEIHNAVNAGTQNNQLARTLAPLTDSLILASATPHSGNDQMFSELLSLLDPLAVNPDGSINNEVAQRLIIRRHRSSPEVAQVVGGKWAEREEPRNILVDASPAEDAIARELQKSWLGPDSVAISTLFPWTLVKAYLSSGPALTQSVTERLSRATDPAEIAALHRLRDLAADLTPDNSAKFCQLVDYLKSIGVGPKSPMRAVVFSERVATLKWLRDNLPKALGLADNQVAVMHGGLPDVTQLQVVGEFKKAESPLRVLVTGDVASEGINLHAQCHDLIHFDIPWSLIRIQQRNGRIDRYGQEKPPRIVALILQPTSSDTLPGEAHVLTRLVQREHEAHKVLGDAALLMGKFSEAREEDQIVQALRRERDIDQVVPAVADLHDPSETVNFMLRLAQMCQQEDAQQPSTGDVALDTLYTAEVDYLRDSLSVALPTDPQRPAATGGVDFADHPNGVTEFTPPPDLVRRFDALPAEYVKERKIEQRLTLATTKQRGDASLIEARNSSTTSWPKAHFLSPLHPATQWASERAMSAEREAAARSDAAGPALQSTPLPVVAGDVSMPTVVVMGLLSNGRGQTISRMKITVTRLGATPQPSLSQWLRDVGVPGPNRPLTSVNPDDIRALVLEAASSAQQLLDMARDSMAAQAAQVTADWCRDADAWEEQAGRMRASERLASRRRVIAGIRSELDRLAPNEGTAVVRPLLVVMPRPEGE